MNSFSVTPSSSVGDFVFASFNFRQILAHRLQGRAEWSSGSQSAGRVLAAPQLLQVQAEDRS